MLFVQVSLLMIFVLAAHVSAEQNQFQHWFPSVPGYYNDILHNSCQQEYETYLNEPSCPNCQLDYPLSGNQRATIAVINCLLGNTSEFIKANNAAGTVVLGVLPTLLSFTGSSTSEIGLLAIRRPLLATLLAVGSPSIYPIRTLDYEDPLAIVRPGHTPFTVAATPIPLWLSSTFQYVLALAAAANVATQFWSLCINTIAAIGPDFKFWPLFWPIATLFMHLLGWIYVSLRVRLDRKGNSLKDKVSIEFTPSARHERYTPVLRPQTLLSLLLTWLVSVLTICHILYGTLALSSLLFTSVVDAVYVALRLWASAVVARAVVVFELSGMASSLNLRPPGFEEGCKKEAHPEKVAE